MSITITATAPDEESIGLEGNVGAGLQVLVDHLRARGLQVTAQLTNANGTASY